MNIALTSIHIRRSPDASPLGPALIKSYIEKYSKRDLKVSIYEFYLNRGVSKVAKEILKNSPSVIGLSIYLWNRSYYLDLIKEIRKTSSAIIIAGGPEVRSSYKELLYGGVNYTLQGEGEEIFLEVIESLATGRNPLDISGVNDDRSRFIDNLDSLPSPILNGDYNLKGRDGILWELSRGCPFACDFCFESRGSKGVRYYSLDRVKKELQIIKNSNVPQVFVLDPTFNKDLNRAKTILKEIKKLKLNTHFHFEVRAEFIDDELSKLFSDIGSSIQIGIQSGSDNVLKNVNRRLNRELFSKKMAILNRNGVVFGLDLIYGLPGDNYDGFKDSMEYVLSLQPNHIDIFPLAVLPGTKLLENSEKFNLNYLKEPPYTIIDSPTFSKKDMERSSDLKNGCDFIFNRGKSTGWLLQVTKELKISQVEFIEGFISFLGRDKLLNEGNEIVAIRDYIDSIKAKNRELIIDIINYHWFYSKALLSKKKGTRVDKNRLLSSVPKLSKSATLVKANYDILDAFYNGLFLINEIKSIYRPFKNSYITWYNLQGGVHSDIYDDTIMKFIKGVDGKRASVKIDKNIDLEFLTFAQDTGLLLFR